METIELLLIHRVIIWVLVIAYCDRRCCKPKPEVTDYQKVLFSAESLCLLNLFLCFIIISRGMDSPVRSESSSAKQTERNGNVYFLISFISSSLYI